MNPQDAIRLSLQGLCYILIMNGPNYDIYRFDCFEVRVKAGVLLRKGQRVRIQELPFRMLLALLENPGKIVSREELRQRLWNQQSFGELDNGLHVAAAKLREALDQPKRPMRASAPDDARPPAES